ncbi:hypothetical protein CKAH01_05803 [Colletotrichum kahawae]|uniref:MARVEL domain-containing protein n=1 Tax=Colletotrichum kahawae TaxID=34407 RepID=A0AAE0D797_COLKA|nr:hypothetical protein CKAH01_05803 [Colletotrichum kahawae]
MIRDYWDLAGPFGLAVRATLRILQFILSISPDISRTDWIFALVPACLSILTCAYHVIATVTHAVWCVWDFVLAVLWAALAGVSASDVIAKGGGNTVTGGAKSRLTAGSWIAGVLMVLYLFNAVHGCAWCCASRKFTRTVPERNKTNSEELQSRDSQNA